MYCTRVSIMFSVRCIMSGTSVLLFRLVGWEELSSEAERLTAVLQERHSELHSMLQQVCVCVSL